MLESCPYRPKSRKWLEWVNEVKKNKFKDFSENDLFLLRHGYGEILDGKFLGVPEIISETKDKYIISIWIKDENKNIPKEVVFEADKNSLNYEDEPLYDEVDYGNGTIKRIFNENHFSNDYKWHQDESDRVIKILRCGDGWKFQFDDEEPFLLKKGLKIFISKDRYHRLIKGKGQCEILIKNLKNEY